MTALPPNLVLFATISDLLKFCEELWEGVTADFVPPKKLMRKSNGTPQEG